jgi:cytoskeleton protein RodZ
VIEPDAGRVSAGDGPGPLLRRAREALGLTEQQAAEQLNLDATVVHALESDDLAALGAPVFARGHLRRYGTLLGLPEESLLAAYEQAANRPAQPSLVPHSRQEMAPVSRGRLAWPWALGGALLFLAAAGVVAYVSEFGFTLPQVGAGGEPAASVALESGGEPQTGITVPVQVGATGAGEPTAAETPVDAGASPGPDGAAPVVPPGHVSLSISFAADSWAEIYDGSGQTVLYDLGRAGTERKIAAAAPLSVTLGNASAVTLLANGRAVPVPLPPAGQSVARFTITADGSLRKAGG